MNEKTKTVSTNVATKLTMYRVNYSYVAKSGALRQGSVVVEANDITEAQREAPLTIAKLGVNTFRITRCVEF